MKRWITLAFVLAMGLAALVTAERRKATARVSPDALLYFVADTEHELTRLPVTYTRISDKDEIEIGNHLADQYWFVARIDNKDTDSRDLQEYVSRVGSKVAAHAHRKLPYKFHYIPRPGLVNAFALPGGHVYIGRGLMELMDTEDELASVLGHEIEHIDHYHCAERIQLEARARKLRLSALAVLATIPIEVFQAGYSKTQELEADREGARLAVASSYSPLGSIRLFEALDVKHREVEEAPRSPQDEAGRLVVSTIEGYFRSHPPSSDRITQIQRMIADEHWEGLTKETPLGLGYLFWTSEADRELAAHKYEHAASVAKHSVEIKPDQPNAWLILANSQFALADFTSSAASYRRYLDFRPLDTSAAQGYADALYAARDRDGAPRFKQWVAARQGSADPLLEADDAGLLLIAGDGAPAKALVEKAVRTDGAFAPDVLGRLGWWYYRKGFYDESARLLGLAVEQRPRSVEYQSHLGWVLLDQQRYSSAIHSFELTGGTQMGLAIANWQGKQADAALNEFASSTRFEPQWLNPKWVQSLYSPLVARSISEMKSEQEKRELARKARERERLSQ